MPVSGAGGAAQLVVAASSEALSHRHQDSTLVEPGTEIERQE